MSRHFVGVHLTSLGEAINTKQVPDTATPEFFALRYLARMIHDPRIPREVKAEIAEVLIRCCVPVVADPE